MFWYVCCQLGPWGPVSPYHPAEISRPELPGITGTIRRSVLPGISLTDLREVPPETHASCWLSLVARRLGAKDHNNSD